MAFEAVLMLKTCVSVRTNEVNRRKLLVLLKSLIYALLDTENDVYSSDVERYYPLYIYTTCMTSRDQLHYTVSMSATVRVNPIF